MLFCHLLIFQHSSFCLCNGTDFFYFAVAYRLNLFSAAGIYLMVLLLLLSCRLLHRVGFTFNNMIYNYIYNIIMSCVFNGSEGFKSEVRNKGAKELAPF